MTSDPRADHASDRANLLVVRGWEGQPSREELEQAAEEGARPRVLYVELARALDADLLDANALATHGAARSRAVGKAVGMLEAEVVEAFIRRRRYRAIIAFADRIGLELALLLKLRRSRKKVALVSSRLAAPSKALYLDRLRVQTHLGPIVSYSSVQLELAAARYGLRPETLHLALQPVDERYWAPRDEPTDDLICAVGCVTGYRDYRTLVAAVSDLPVRVELAIGNLVPSSRQHRERVEKIEATLPRASLPTNVDYRFDVPLPALRELYARSRFVVMPLEDVDFDAGVTAITEAMAMGKAVVVTAAKGQVDVVREGVEGLYVPPGDPRALRQAISHLLENPADAERMGARGREAVLARHRLDDYTQRVARILLASADGGAAG